MGNSEKKVLGIVKDSPANFDSVSFHEFNRACRRAASNMYENPQENFDRGVEAMIQAYKEIGPFDFVAVIGECGLADVVTSSQNFFPKEVEKKFSEAGIDVAIASIAATTNKFWSEEVIIPIEEAAGKINKIEIRSCQVSQGKAYRYYFDRFNYDRHVVVYKIIPK